MNLLLVEDDDMIASGLSYSFEAEGFTIFRHETAKSALDEISRREFGIAILDLSLPDGSGFDVCEAFKAKHSAPVIFLTAVDDEPNTVRGLEMGADDYITKPFRIRELLARIKTVLRRNSAQTDILRFGKIRVHVSQGKVLKDGAEIILTASEYRLLLMLAQNKGQILSRNRLLESLWDSSGEFVNDNTLSVCIKRLREKLGDCPREPELIETVRGIGYRIRSQHD